PFENSERSRPDCLLPRRTVRLQPDRSRYHRSVRAGARENRAREESAPALTHVNNPSARLGHSPLDFELQGKSLLPSGRQDDLRGHSVWELVFLQLSSSVPRSTLHQVSRLLPAADPIREFRGF